MDGIKHEIQTICKKFNISTPTRIHKNVNAILQNVHHRTRHALLKRACLLLSQSGRKQMTAKHIHEVGIGNNKIGGALETERVVIDDWLKLILPYVKVLIDIVDNGNRFIIYKRRESLKSEILEKYNITQILSQVCFNKLSENGLSHYISGNLYGCICVTENPPQRVENNKCSIPFASKPGVTFAFFNIRSLQEHSRNYKEKDQLDKMQGYENGNLVEYTIVNPPKRKLQPGVCDNYSEIAPYVNVMKIDAICSNNNGGWKLLEYFCDPDCSVFDDLNIHAIAVDSIKQAYGFYAKHNFKSTCDLLYEYPLYQVIHSDKPSEPVYEYHKEYKDIWNTGMINWNKYGVFIPRYIEDIHDKSIYPLMLPLQSFYDLCKRKTTQ